MDAREVEGVRRLRREGLSVEEAREGVIGERGGGPTVGKGGPDRRRAGGREKEADRGDDPQENEGVGVKQAAHQLGISETTVRRRVERGELMGAKDKEGRLQVRLGGQEKDRGRAEAGPGREESHERGASEPGIGEEDGRKEKRRVSRSGPTRSGKARGRSREGEARELER